jgi:hypothetical protein
MDTLELLHRCLDCLQAGCTAQARDHLAEWRQLGINQHQPLARLLGIGIDLQEREDRGDTLPTDLLDSVLAHCRQDLAALALARTFAREAAPQAEALAANAVSLVELLGVCLGYHLTAKRQAPAHQSPAPFASEELADTAAAVIT